MVVWIPVIAVPDFGPLSIVYQLGTIINHQSSIINPFHVPAPMGCWATGAGWGGPARETLSMISVWTPAGTSL